MTQSAATPQAWQLLLAAAVILAAVCFGFWLARRWSRYRMRRRFARGKRAEADAAKYLESEGYRIVDVQANRIVDVVVDGWPQRVEVVADILAVKGGRHCVIEVKTGDKAVDPLYPPTRRQLLEYRLAFGPCDLMLLDMEAGEEHFVRFPALSRSEPRSPAKWIAIALAVGLAAGFLAARFLPF